jgi:TolB-like protein/Tfp pilus assembly protein PilF
MADETSFSAEETRQSNGKRLESWKEIASHLGRDVRTVQRWEQGEGLPVHRLHHKKQGSVYAFASEIDAWLSGRRSATQLDDTTQRETRFAAWRRFLPAAALLASAVALIAGPARFWFQPSPEPGAEAGLRIRSLAVLPLEDFSGNPDQGYFADGMTEAIIGRLSAIRDLRVVSRTSVMQYKSMPKPVPAIAKELSVDAIVEGSVQRAGQRVQITVQLIRGASDEHLWSKSYERELVDALALQGEVAQAIAQQIEVALTGKERNRLTASRPIAPEVYESYLQGRYQLHKGSHKGSKAAVEESVRHFERAIRVDPTFAPAYVALATAYSVFGGTAIAVSSVVEASPKAVAAARKALELDPHEMEAHLVLARLRQRDWQWDEAEAGYRQVLELDPNNASAYSSLASVLMWRGRTEEAVALGRRARLLDPLSLRNSAALGWILYHARRYEESIRELEAVLAIEPDRFGAAWFLGFALLDAGRPEEAIQVLERSGAHFGRVPAVLGVLCRAYARAGRREEAIRVLDELERHRRTGYVPPAAFVHAYVGVGDHEQAFIWLERAYQEHSNLIQFLTTHPMLDPLRNDPRFSDLVRRARLG